MLDELFVRLRNGFFREAYMLLIIVVTALLVVHLIVARFPAIVERTADALFAPVIALSIGLPAIVAAFRLPDLDETG